FLAFAITAAACGPQRLEPPHPVAIDAAPRVVGYLFAPAAHAPGLIAALPANALTHIDYAFANISPAGTMILGNPCFDVGACDSTQALPDTLGGSFRALAALKAAHPHLRLLMSIGGWAWSGRFSDVALTDSSRQAFVTSGVELFLHKWPGLFDGFDIDWEFPVSGGMPTNAARPEDRANYTLLLAELRRQLDAETQRTGRKYTLTVALNAHAPRNDHVEFDRITPLVDWINVMTYDFHDRGSPIANFNAPLHSPVGDVAPSYNVDSSITMYLAAGVPASKIVVGVPFYGRAFGGVAPEHDGLLQPTSGAAPTDVTGGMDYKSLVAKQLEKNGFTRHWDTVAQVPWLYNPATGTWITYDDEQSIGAKAAWAHDHALGGVMIWQLAGDDDGKLATVIARHIFRR
ncbi:MAG: glycoside hydrolase family 18 protein, partial [Gemmatimonadaceae bacterium]